MEDSNNSQTETKHNTPAVEPSWIPFSEWNPESKKVYIESAERNMDELQKELSNKCSRTNTLIAVNGTVIGLILAFIVNSKLFDGGISEWMDYLLIAGFCVIFASFVIIVWMSFESRESPVMDFWVGANSIHQELMNSPGGLEEDFLNGFIQRCDDTKNAVERIARIATICGRIFAVGLTLLLLAIIYLTVS